MKTALDLLRTATLAATLIAGGTAAAADAVGVSAACLTDLEALPDFLRINDTGAPEHLAQKGPQAFADALNRARMEIAGIADDEGCIKAIRGFLRTYRRGHLAILPVSPPGDDGPVPAVSANDEQAPRFRRLSPRTVMIVLPTFDDRYTALVESLIKAHRRELATTPNLIVDVRANGGGSDSTYASLMPYIDANITRSIGAEFLATPANIEASEAVCEDAGHERDICRKFMEPVLKAMRSVPSGTYARIAGEEPVTVENPKTVARFPQHVGVMIDRSCGSSCEEFVLAVRQSVKVKVFGRPTYGSLDYSNLRPHVLPSGRHRVLYATSRSLRLPGFAVDTAGLQPDQFLPKPADAAGYDAEVDTVRQVLESAR